jgi:hypothetical protein
MAYTYSKIATYAVGSGGIANVSFLNIPQTYTDLIIKMSARSSGTGDIALQFNGLGNTNNDKVLYYVGLNTTGSNSQTNGFLRTPSNMNASTANTFSNNEAYITNYTSSNYKSISIDGVAEDNGTTYNGIYLTAGLVPFTQPITSITIDAYSTETFLQYSTFHLYGIKAEV